MLPIRPAAIKMRAMLYHIFRFNGFPPYNADIPFEIAQKMRNISFERSNPAINTAIPAPRTIHPLKWLLQSVLLRGERMIRSSASGRSPSNLTPQQRQKKRCQHKHEVEHAHPQHQAECFEKERHVFCSSASLMKISAFKARASVLGFPKLPAICSSLFLQRRPFGIFRRYRRVSLCSSSGRSFISRRRCFKYWSLHIHFPSLMMLFTFSDRSSHSDFNV